MHILQDRKCTRKKGPVGSIVSQGNFVFLFCLTCTFFFFDTITHTHSSILSFSFRNSAPLQANRQISISSFFFIERITLHGMEPCYNRCEVDATRLSDKALQKRLKLLQNASFFLCSNRRRPRSLSLVLNSRFIGSFTQDHGQRLCFSITNRNQASTSELKVSVT